MMWRYVHEKTAEEMADWKLRDGTLSKNSFKDEFIFNCLFIYVAYAIFSIKSQFWDICVPKIKCKNY